MAQVTKRTAAPKTKRATAPETPPQFTKAQLLQAQKYRGRQDLLAALLVDGRAYTLAEADEKITAYMKGKVK